MNSFLSASQAQRIGVRTVATTSLVALAGLASFAQTAAPPSVKVALSAPAAAVSTMAKPDRAKAVARPSRMTISFHNADTADVVRAIAMQSGLSVAVTPSVKGKVISVRLRDVTAEEAMQLVADAAGLSVRKNGKSYLLGTDEELKKLRGGNTVATVALSHLTPDAARGMLEIVAPQVTVTAASGGRQVILSGGAGDVEQAQIALVAADTPAPPTADILTPKHVSAQTLKNVFAKAEPGLGVDVQENVAVLSGAPDAIARARALMPIVDTVEGAGQRVEVYRIRYSSADALTPMLIASIPGITVTPSAEPFAPASGSLHSLSSNYSLGRTSTAGGSTGGDAGGGGGGGGTTTESGGTAHSVTKSRQLILSGPDDLITKAINLLAKVDVAPTQVEIVARIVDINRSNDFDFGVQWGGYSVGQSTGTTTTTSTPTITQGSSITTATEGTSPGLLRFGRLDRTSINIAAQLRFLEVNNRAKTLANPRISAIDNEDASIFIGEVRRFQILAAASATAGNAFTVVEIPVGVTLLVRPRVNENGDITLKIHPSVSALSGLVGDLPQTSTREADTTMRMRDGETVVIGGLLRDDEIKSMEQVPYLGNIPVFGELFRRRKNTKTRSEVVLFLTARLLPDAAAAPSGASSMATPTPLSSSLAAPDAVPSSVSGSEAGKGGK